MEGCDISRAAVDTANERVQLEGSAFHVVDLTGGASALSALPLRPKYDIVCYLGMHHHLKGQMSPAALQHLTVAILGRSSDIFVARTPLRHFDELHEMIMNGGFAPVGDLEVSGKVGPSRVYRRTMPTA